MSNVYGLPETVSKARAPIYAYCASCGLPLESGRRADRRFCVRTECVKKRAYARQRASLENTGKARQRASLENTGKASPGSTGRGKGTNAAKLCEVPGCGHKADAHRRVFQDDKVRREACYQCDCERYTNGRSRQQLRDAPYGTSL